MTKDEKDEKDEGLEYVMGLDEIIAQLPEGHLARGELAALRSTVAAYTKLINEEGFPPKDMGDDNVVTGAVGGMKSFIESLLPGMDQKARRHELVQMVGHVLPVILETEEDNWPDADDVAEYAVKYAKAALARIDEEIIKQRTPKINREDTDMSMNDTIPIQLRLYGADMPHKIWQAFCELHKIVYEHAPEKLPVWFRDYTVTSIEALCKQSGMEPGGFMVVLQDYDPNRKIQIIKAIRETAGLSLMDSKKMSERLPAVVVPQVTGARAREIAMMFEASGGKVEVREIL